MRSSFSAKPELDFTVAIPTYNGANRLSEVLEKLKTQISTDFFRWEILIVDNNSTDNTAALIQNYQKTWTQSSPLRYTLETQQGASFARLKAVQEAKGKWVGFLDDDTIPTENWVAAAYTFGEKYPQAGAYGSQVHGDYEVEPPQNFERIASFFAITERGSQPHRYEPKMRMLPPSAGLVVLKQAWCESVPQKPFLSGRSSRSILNSEDLEMILYIQNAGWEIWYNPEMEIYHKIPRQRLERDYLLYLMRSTGLARHYIRMLRFKTWQKPFVFPLGFSRDVYKAIYYFLKHRQEFDRDIVTACEMEFLFSSTISPFYLWSQSIKSWLTSR
jgi:glycosyltransferase involved in cell wall biosynthesis